MTARIVRVWWNRPNDEWVLQVDGGELEPVAYIEFAGAHGQTFFRRTPGDPRAWLQFHNVLILRQDSVVRLLAA